MNSTTTSSYTAFLIATVVELDSIATRHFLNKVVTCVNVAVVLHHSYTIVTSLLYDCYITRIQFYQIRHQSSSYRHLRHHVIQVTCVHRIHDKIDCNTRTYVFEEKISKYNQYHYTTIGNASDVTVYAKQQVGTTCTSDSFSWLCHDNSDVRRKSEVDKHRHHKIISVHLRVVILSYY